MTDALVKKKRTRVGHKAFATQTVREIKDIFENNDLDKSKLALLQLMLNKNLETIKKLDAEIVNLMDDETVLAEEIEQVNSYKEVLFSALIKADKLLKDTPTATPNPVLAVHLWQQGLLLLLKPMQ